MKSLNIDPPPPDQVAKANYEFERPLRDALYAARAVQTLLDKAVAMDLIARCMARNSRR